MFSELSSQYETQYDWDINAQGGKRIKCIWNCIILLLPFILLTERQTQCHYSWQVMAVFCEMGNIVGSSSEIMFSPWSQSWLRLPLMSYDFKGMTPRKQFCVFCSCCQEAPVSPPTCCPRSLQQEAFLCHPLFNNQISFTSLTSSLLYSEILSLHAPVCHQHGIIRHIYSSAGMEHGYP